MKDDWSQHTRRTEKGWTQIAPTNRQRLKEKIWWKFIVEGHMPIGPLSALLWCCAQVFSKCNYSFQCKPYSVKECRVSETFLMPVSCLISEFFFLYVRHQGRLRSFWLCSQLPFSGRCLQGNTVFNICGRLSSKVTQTRCHESEKRTALAWVSTCQSHFSTKCRSTGRVIWSHSQGWYGTRELSIYLHRLLLARGITRYLGLWAVGGTGNRSNRNIEAPGSLAFPSWFTIVWKTVRSHLYLVLDQDLALVRTSEDWETILIFKRQNHQH